MALLLTQHDFLYKYVLQGKLSFPWTLLFHGSNAIELNRFLPSHSGRSTRFRYTHDIAWASSWKLGSIYVALFSPTTAGNRAFLETPQSEDTNAVVGLKANWKPDKQVQSCWLI